MYEAGESVAGEKKKVFYLKPVSTGSADEADDRCVLSFFLESWMLIVEGSYVKRNIGLGRHSWAGKIDTKCLYQYREPVSPHLAARLAPELVSLVVGFMGGAAHNGDSGIPGDQ
jgi:dethiobiotin synthetase/adenosylmethionine--8-amino-7-oxononanoate aminotransferase